MKLPETLVSIFEKAVNHYLSLDDSMPEKLARLNDKLIAVELTDIEQTVYFHFMENHVAVSSTTARPVDTTIKGTLLALAKTGMKSPDSSLLFNSGIEVSGDSELGKKFQNIINNIEIDWEELLSKYTGDTIAYQIGSTARELQRWAKQALAIIEQNTTEYLQEESRNLPHPIEIDRFLDEVDQLRLATDRIEARILRLRSSR